MGRQSGITWRHRATGALILTGALALSACAGEGDDASDSADEPASEEPALEEQSSEEPADDRGNESAAIGEPAADVAIDLGRIGRDVIIEMYVTLSSDDIQRSVASVTARASALGGGIASSDVNYGNPSENRPDSGHAVLVVKVPPAAVDDLLTGLEQAGTIQSINQSAQDVTEQLVDLDVRIANARESVENVRGFMERTEDLSELVTLEGELSRRQTELERLEAQERNLSERVALSTVTIEIVPTASVPEPPAEEDDSIGRAFEKGWDGFLTMIWGIGYVLAVLAPFLAVAGVIALVTLWVVRRRSARGRAPVEPVGPVAPPADENEPDEEPVPV